jgi:hypothetical protein
MYAAVCLGSGSDNNAGDGRCCVATCPQLRGLLALLFMLILFIDFKSLLVPTSFVLSHRFLRLPSCRHLLLCVQAKATNDVFGFVLSGDVAGLRKCITDGANVDKNKGPVREKEP